MNDITLSIKLPPDLARRVEHAWLAAAKSYAVDSPELYEAAAEDLRAIKRRLVELDDERKNLTRPLDEAKARIMEFFRPPRELLEEGEKHLKRAMLTYQAEEERKRKALEARLREEAQRKRERLAAEAAAMEAAGHQDHAELKREQAEEVITPIVAHTTPKPKGISISETWRAAITDKMALVQAVATGKAPAELVDVNMQVANRLALSLKQAFAYPGLKAVKGQSLAASRRG